MKDLAKLGTELVCCDRRCEGVACDRPRGLLPRGLVVEERSGSEGVVMVGINPGHATVAERAYYRERGGTYLALLAFFREHLANRHQYYLRLRKFADAAGLSGSILWTELAKCENALAAA